MYGEAVTPIRYPSLNVTFLFKSLYGPALREVACQQLVLNIGNAIEG